MAKSKPAAKPAKKSEAKLSPRVRSPKKKAARKAKPSTAKRYAARTAKREEWAKANPTMTPGEIGKPASLKPVEVPPEAPATDAQVAEAIAEAPFEKEQEAAQEMLATQAEVRAADEVPAT